MESALTIEEDYSRLRIKPNGEVTYETKAGQVVSLMDLPHVVIDHIAGQISLDKGQIVEGG